MRLMRLHFMLDQRPRLLAAHAGIAIGALLLCGCSDLASVDAPEVIQPGDYETAAGATALAAGAITQFHKAFGGGTYSNQVVLSGLLADELAAAAIGNVSQWDSRELPDPAPNGAAYEALQQARQKLLSAIGSFQHVAPDSTSRIGQLFTLLGYTSVFFGETYCAGVPLSHRDPALRPVYGRPLSTAQLFDSALVAFDSALSYGADDDRIANLARVGRGRALLNLGRFGDAADAVTAVATTYGYDVTYLAEFALENGLSNTPTSPQRNFTVPEMEGTNGIKWRSAGDPRVRLVNRSPEIIGYDGATDIWQFESYQASTAPIRLASGVEARLIEAESALQAGDVAAWLALHNTLRATVTPPLPVLADPVTPEDRVRLHFRERAFWLFLTAHRQGDLRRLVRQYGHSAESVFPTGLWRDGIFYGAETTMAPPATQAINPHYMGCLNRDA